MSELHDDLGNIRSEDFFGVQTFVDILEQFKGTIQPKYLRFMTPYQRIGVHLDEYQLVDFAEQVADGTVRFAATLLPWLDEHHYTYAMLSDPRVFVRLFSKHLLRASVTISSFHKDLDASLMAQYVDLVAASAGLVIVLTDDAGNARIESAPHGGAQEELYPGSAWKWQPWDDSDPAVARVFVYVTADEGNIGSSGSTNFEDIRAELEEHIAKVAARVVDVQLDSGLLSVKPSDVRTNFVTDGLNYLIALTNVAQGELPDGTATGIATGTLSLAAAMRIAADPGSPGTVYAYALTEVTSSLTPGRTPPLVPGTLMLSTDVGFQQMNPTSDVIIDFELKPRETKLIYLGAQVSGLDSSQMQMASAQLRTALLGMEGQGYDTSDGMRALDYIDDMLGQATSAPLERVLAGLIQVKNTIVLRTEKRVDDATFRVTAARLGLPGSTMAEPVSGEVQILHVLNGHEEQDAGGLSASTARVTIGPTMLPHWDFGQSAVTQSTPGAAPKFVTSLTGSKPGQDPVEVHVHDPVLGTESFVLVASEPRVPVLPKTAADRPIRPTHPIAP